MFSIQWLNEDNVQEVCSFRYGDRAVFFDEGIRGQNPGGCHKFDGKALKSEL